MNSQSKMSWSTLHILLKIWIFASLFFCKLKLVLWLRNRSWCWASWRDCLKHLFVSEACRWNTIKASAHKDLYPLSNIVTILKNKINIFCKKWNRICLLKQIQLFNSSLKFVLQVITYKVRKFEYLKYPISHISQIWVV